MYKAVLKIRDKCINYQDSSSTRCWIEKLRLREIQSHLANNLGFSSNIESAKLATPWRPSYYVKLPKKSYVLNILCIQKRQKRLKCASTLRVICIFSAKRNSHSHNLTCSDQPTIAVFFSKPDNDNSAIKLLAICLKNRCQVNSENVLNEKPLITEKIQINEMIPVS